MLVLSRKVDQRIMIGDDVTLTVVRIDGNRVRIGIEAPQEKRILRGELAASMKFEIDDQPLDHREMAFAHPPESLDLAATGGTENKSATARRSAGRAAYPTTSQVFDGKIAADGSRVCLQSDSVSDDSATPRTTGRCKVAPLSGFVAAT